jgi:multidrug efflux pump subunit AcrA (membrane-fusion protein)
MSTGLIIAIVIVAIILLAVLFFIPRMREQARVKARERELGKRREAVAGQHREVADTRQQEAEQAERQARMAQKEAERQRAEAELHQERATMHERGDADHELIDEHERDRFAGTSAMSGGTPERGDGAGSPDRDRDDTPDDQEAGGQGTGARSEFEQGREVGHEEERSGRFARDETPADQPTGPRPA